VLAPARRGFHQTRSAQIAAANRDNYLVKAIATEASDDDPLTRIVAAARRLFAENGVSRTRLEDVSAAVGISRQYLYRFVSGRDGLIELALLARCRELGAQLEARAHLDADDVTAAVADQVVAGAMIAHDDEFVLLAEAMPRDRLNALLTGADSPLHRINMRVYGPLFARAIGAGLLRTDVSVDAMVTWLQGVMTMLAGRSDLDEGSMHDVVDTFVVPSLFS
jgi:AcrR family transcriptional regulator